ncbi:MAG: DUF2807 domain-containing protein [Bacteroidetes bacterium]|nr:DUF2807 domain-containing protein [Bacteroidota bacterium]
MKTTKKEFISGLLLLVFLVIASCNVIGEEGSGNVIRQERKVSSFDAIDVGGAFDVILTQGTTQSVFLEADDNLLELIRTEVRGNTLMIDTKKPISHPKCLKIFITFTDLKKIDVSGAVDVESQGKLTMPELSFSGSGASNTSLDLEVQKLNIDCSGGNKLRLSGSAKDVDVDVSGAVDLFAFDLPADNYSISISGAGKAEITVNKSLNVDISGAASVRYKGNPERNFQDISGSGSVKKVD